MQCWPADSQQKCRMKRCLELENNTAGHMTFAGRLTCQPELLYMYDIHILMLFIHFLY